MKEEMHPAPEHEWGGKDVAASGLVNKSTYRSDTKIAAVGGKIILV